MAANPKKRKRDGRDVNVGMIKIYQDLADEDPKVRLSATRALLSRFNEESTPVTPEQYTTTVTRLIRGLCSGRKAARLGFSVALTEFLTQTSRLDASKRGLTEKDLLKIVEQQTTPQIRVSGQDERDHLFGRLFAADAIVESTIFLQTNNPVELCRPLFELLVDLARKKIWLRQECGWCLFKFLRSTRGDHVKLAEALLQLLAEQAIIRSSEGLAIWLLVKEQYPNANFPKQVWKHDNPLHPKEKALLAEVMRDATPKRSPEEDDRTSEGAGLWGPQLHFCWDMLLKSFKEANLSEDDAKRMDFSTFWAETIDRGLLSASSSVERKHWAFLVVQKVVQESAVDMISSVLSAGFLSCLKNQLASSERTLHADAKRVCQALQERAAKDPEFAVVAVTSLLGPAGHINWDRITKTSTTEKIVADASQSALHSITNFLEQTFIDQRSRNQTEIEPNRQSATEWLTFISTRQGSKGSSDATSNLQTEIILFMMRYAYFVPNEAIADNRKPNPPLSGSTRGHLHLRISNCLEHNLRGIDAAFAGVYEIMNNMWAWTQDDNLGLDTVVEIDSAITGTISVSWANLKSISAFKDSKNQLTTAIGLLYCVSLLLFYSGDPSMVALLEDLHEIAPINEGELQELFGNSSTAATDSIIDILLAFISKPSKFLRRVCLLVFESILPRMTQHNLESLFKILSTRESLQGQGDLFDAEESPLENNLIESRSDTSSDSDVEIVQQEKDGASTVSTFSSDNVGSEFEQSPVQAMESGEDMSSDSELAAFDAKLAAALKTHRGGEDLDASSSVSDEDISDSEMEAIDEQLAAVFAARKEASKAKKSKSEHKSARENMINFKNRILDLIEILFKSQKDNPLALASLAPVLSAARFTNSKQVSNRIYQVLRAFNDRCKGKSHVPPCQDSIAALSYLRAIHEEAKQDISHTHAMACGNASVLIVRVLVHNNHHSESITQVVDLYAESTKAFLVKGYIMPGFFTAWNNWYVQTKGPVVEVRKPVSAAKKHKSIGKEPIEMGCIVDGHEETESTLYKDQDQAANLARTTRKKRMRRKRNK